MYRKNISTFNGHMFNLDWKKKNKNIPLISALGSDFPPSSWLFKIERRASSWLTQLQLQLKSDYINSHTQARSDWSIHLRSAQKVNAVAEMNRSFLFTVYSSSSRRAPAPRCINTSAAGMWTSIGSALNRIRIICGRAHNSARCLSTDIRLNQTQVSGPPSGLQLLMKPALKWISFKQTVLHPPLLRSSSSILL